jgi:hypothetical protein
MISTYPECPGHKVGGTSEAAAAEIKPSAKVLQVRVFSMLKHRDLTADECADLMGESILSIRPRFSELKRIGMIHDSGERRKNASGKSAVVWTAKEVFKLES